MVDSRIGSPMSAERVLWPSITGPSECVPSVVRWCARSVRAGANEARKACAGSVGQTPFAGVSRRLGATRSRSGHRASPSDCCAVFARAPRTNTPRPTIREQPGALAVREESDGFNVRKRRGNHHLCGHHHHLHHLCGLRHRHPHHLCGLHQHRLQLLFGHHRHNLHHLVLVTIIIVFSILFWSPSSSSSSSSSFWSPSHHHHHRRLWPRRRERKDRAPRRARARIPNRRRVSGSGEAETSAFGGTRAIRGGVEEASREREKSADEGVAEPSETVPGPFAP